MTTPAAVVVCEGAAAAPGISRRGVLAALVGAVAQPVPIGGGVAVNPRAAWGADLPPQGPIDAEAPGDVRFLLVHHTVSANGYAAAEVPGLLRGIYAFHTGPEKGWPDIAYNFFVDAHGGVWEGRTGSLDAPVKGSATGGSQGYAQLCCFVGDHQTEAPTAAAQTSMVALLAWLAGRYGIDPSPGATTTFTSRGSQKWPAGTTVTTTTIAGHREMSNTVCPGDAAFVLVRDRFPTQVQAAMGQVLPASPDPAEPQSTTSTEAPTTEPPAEEPPVTGDGSSTSAGDPAPTTPSSGPSSGLSSGPSSTLGDREETAAAPSSASDGDPLRAPLGAAAVVCGAVGGLLWWRAHRMGRAPSSR